MKRLLFLPVFIFPFLINSSCRKDYSCECADSLGVIKNVQFNNQKNNEAEEACHIMDTTYQADGGSCELKMGNDQ